MFKFCVKISLVFLVLIPTKQHPCKCYKYDGHQTQDGQLWDDVIKMIPSLNVSVGAFARILEAIEGHRQEKTIILKEVTWES